LGASNDGGYVVSSEAIDGSELLLSFGLGDDWSFEQDYVRRTGRPVACFDPIGSHYWALYTLHGVLRLSWRRATRFLLYRRFFASGSAVHHRIKIGHDVAGSTSLNSILATCAAERIFLKVDIEGSEYRILDDIVAHAQRFTGLVVEFHDVDLNRDRISDLICRLTDFEIVNVHGNNFGGLDGFGDPIVAEISLARRRYCGGSISGSSALNAPNHPGLPEIALNFEEPDVTWLTLRSTRETRSTSPPVL